MAARRIFVSYVQENRDTVARLVAALRERGLNVWFDRDALPAGVFWRDEIRRAVRDHDYFIACFSAEYATRAKSFMNEELELAIEEARMRGPTPWLIPVRLSGDIPDRSVGANTTLRDIQYVDFATTGWADAIDQIVRAVQGNQITQDQFPESDERSAASLEVFLQLPGANALWQGGIKVAGTATISASGLIWLGERTIVTPDTHFNANSFFREWKVNREFRRIFLPCVEQTDGSPRVIHIARLNKRLRDQVIIQELGGISTATITLPEFSALAATGLPFVGYILDDHGVPWVVNCDQDGKHRYAFRSVSATPITPNGACYEGVVITYRGSNARA